MKKFFCVALVANIAFAFPSNSQNEVELDTVTVTASEENDVTYKKVGKNVKSAKTISKQQISSSRDLVRFETGVSVVEGDGRFGTSGYNIRG